MQPPASLKALGDPIYEVFYGLTEQPFAITTDPRFFYLSASHQRAFTELLNGLRRRESLLMLTGDTGTGKTTLCRAVLDALGDRTFSAIILNPYMTGAEVLRIVLRDFGLVSHEELRRGGLAAADVAQLLDTLEGFLRALVPLGSHAVLVLDEAQSLTPAVLDQIRMLTGLEYMGQRLLQVVLCGQPGLLQTVKAEGLLALNERITRRVELTSLPPEEIPGYIQHRLGVAGGTNSVRFDAAAMQTVADLSRGLPRRINVLCDRALQEGRIEGVNVISADLVKRAARALAGVHDALPAAAARAFTGAATTVPAPQAPPASVPVQVLPKPVVPPPVARPAEPAASEGPRKESPAAAAASLAAELPATEIIKRPTPAASAVEPPSETESPAVDDPTPPRLPRPSFFQVQPVALPSEAASTEPAAVPMPVPGATADAQGDAAPSTWPAGEYEPEAEFPVESGARTRELSFGLEKPRQGNLGRKLAAAAAVLAIVAGIGYASWSWDVRDSSDLVGQIPAGPGLSRGTPAVALPMPPAEETDPLYGLRIRRVVAPPVDEPQLVETPPEARVPMATDVAPTFPAN